MMSTLTSLLKPPRNRHSIIKALCLTTLSLLAVRIVARSSVTISPAASRILIERSPYGEYRPEKNATNPHPYRLLLHPVDLCPPRLLLLIYVHSKPDNIATRDIIRQTWANLTAFGAHLRVAFVLGVVPEQPGLQVALRAEASLYNDIIQEDFVDAYRNLTYKAICALKWVSHFCRGARFVVKVDDDVLVDTFSLVRVLTSMPKDEASRGKLWCRVWLFMAVQRQGKWRIDPSEFEEEIYPTYCSGMAYVMTADVVATLYKTSLTVPYFWVDDVYITGMLPRRVNLELIDMQRYFVLQPENMIRQKYTVNDGINSPLFAHVAIGAHVIEDMWRSVVELERFSLKHGTPALLHMARRLTTSATASTSIVTDPRVALMVTPCPLWAVCNSSTTRQVQNS